MPPSGGGPAGPQGPQRMGPPGPQGRGPSGGPAGGPRGAAPPPKLPIAGVKYLVAVASGKGGVGKTTVAVNLAIALNRMGARVGLLDADVYGPNVPLMLGTEEEPRATSERTILPVDAYGLKIISRSEEHTSELQSLRHL